MKIDLRVFCSHQNFLSHARVAAVYKEILQTLCHVVDDPAAAQVAVLHYEAPYYPRLIEEVPSLSSKYLIGYCVWEADKLPAALQHDIAPLDEIWTASAYCYSIFAQAHPQVTWVPHVAEWSTVPGNADLLAPLLDTAEPFFNYMTITQENIPRKNTRGLQQAFEYVAKRLPQARLIVKTLSYPIRAQPTAWQRHPQIVVIDGKLEAAALGALYKLAHVYVSAHFSEGWGLPLADAMLLGTPVLATGYSGNMDFMTPHNSLLVHYTEGRIKPRDEYYKFDESMRWAYPHREHLERQLLDAFNMHQNGTLASRAAQAQHDIAIYNRDNLTHLLAQRLQQIATQLHSNDLQRPGIQHRQVR